MAKMSGFDRSGWPDFSDYVAHFTKDGPLLAGNEATATQKSVEGLSALDRITVILTSRKILATPMAWTGADAVALTECPWGSLLRHAEAYSPYGIGFSKPHLFAAGGGPAFYIRPHQMNAQHEYYRQATGQKHRGFDRSVFPFLTPFAPGYMPLKYRQKHWVGKNVVDYSHEREWRVPHDFTFDYDEVEFVVLERYEDLAQMDKQLKDAIGREKFLLMDVYHQIHDRWPL
jgi:hypothetical protein